MTTDEALRGNRVFLVRSGERWVAVSRSYEAPEWTTDRDYAAGFRGALWRDFWERQGHDCEDLETESTE